MSDIIAQNKKAHFDYILLDRFEAGIELKGPEVKSLRQRRVNLKDSFARIERGEVYLHGMHISPYAQSGQFAPDPIRIRKLLLHKQEIKKLGTFILQRGFTLVPLRIYLKNGVFKIELAVAKGKKLFDKRERMRTRDLDREITRSLKEKR